MGGREAEPHGEGLNQKDSHETYRLALQCIQKLGQTGRTVAGRGEAASAGGPQLLEPPDAGPHAG